MAGFADGFTAGWGLIENMELRKQQAAMAERNMALQEAADKRAADLAPLQQESVRANIDQSKQGLAASQFSLDESKRIAPDLDKQRAAQLTGAGLANASAQQTLDYNNKTMDDRLAASKLALQSATQQLENAKQVYTQADQTNPLVVKEAQLRIENAQQELTDKKNEAAALQNVIGIGAPAKPVTVDDILSDPAKLNAIRPQINQFLSTTSKTGNRLELSKVIPYGNDKFVIAVNTFDAGGKPLEKDRPITANRTNDGEDTVQFFTRDSLNAELAKMQPQAAVKPPQGVAAAQVPAQVQGKGAKVNQGGFNTYAPAVFKEADRAFEKNKLDQLGVTKEEFRRTMFGLTMQESRFNASAVSPKGAAGLTQVMPATGADPGFGVSPLKDASPEENIRFGADYMAKMLGKTKGNVTNALAAYNGGLGNIQKHGGPIPGSAENQAYPTLVRNLGNSELYDQAKLLIGEKPDPSLAAAGAVAAVPGAGSKPEVPASAISAGADESSGLWSWFKGKYNAREAAAEKDANRREESYKFSRIAASGLGAAISPDSSELAGERKTPSAEMGAEYWANRKSMSSGSNSLSASEMKRLDEHYKAFKPVAPVAAAPAVPAVTEPAGLAAAPAVTEPAAPSELTSQQRADAVTLYGSKDPRKSAIGERLLGLDKASQATETIKDKDGNWMIIRTKDGSVVHQGSFGNKTKAENAVKDRKAETDLLVEQHPNVFTKSFTDDKGRVHVEKDPELAQRFMNMVNVTRQDYPGIDITSDAVAPVLNKAFQSVKMLETKFGRPVFESLTPIIAMNEAGITAADPADLELIATKALGLTESTPGLSLAEATKTVIAPRHPIAGALMQNVPALSGGDAMRAAMTISSQVMEMKKSGDKRSYEDLTKLGIATFSSGLAAAAVR